MSPQILLRNENTSGITRIHEVLVNAFGQTAEAEIVENLRKRGAILLSMVGKLENMVVGHILFTMVVHADPQSMFGAGLGPLAVMPMLQKQGIDSKLVEAAISAIQQIGVDYLGILGEFDH